MFKINDYVRYGAKGVFQIKEIQKRRDKNNKRCEWYVLYSNSDGVETKIITPANNNTLRKVLTKEEAYALLDQIDSLDLIWDVNKRTRDEMFHDILVSSDLLKLAQLIKSIHFVREEKLKEGKDISQKDKDVYKNAENLLFEELSVCFDIKKDQVLDFILHHASK